MFLFILNIKQKKLLVILPNNKTTVAMLIIGRNPTALLLLTGAFEVGTTYRTF